MIGFKIKITNNVTKKDIMRVMGIIMIIVSLMLFSNFLINKAIEVFSGGNPNLPIYSVETDEKVVSISFDAAWGNEDTDELLTILDKYDIKATFFLVGIWVDKFQDDVVKIAEAGHDIGNHSSSHPHMTKLSSGQIKEELLETHEKVKALTGIEMDLFRPPFGDYNDNLVSTARDVGYYTIQWDVDSLDWKEYGVDHEIKTVLDHKNLQNGSIVLFHNDTKYTPQALVPIIEGLLDKGYKIIPLSELIIRDEYYMDHTGRQISTGRSTKKDKEDEKDNDKGEFREIKKYQPSTSKE